MVQKLNGAGDPQTAFGSPDSQSWGLAVDAVGNVYFVDTAGNCVQRFSAAPNKLAPSADTVPTAVILAVLVAVVLGGYGVLRRRQKVNAPKPSKP